MTLRLKAVFVIVLSLSTTLAIAQSSTTVLKGAGATFPYPLYTKWFASYHHATPGTEISYEPIGSEGGVRKLLNGEVDFAASDNPELPHEVAPQHENSFTFFPSVVGAVVPIINLPNFLSDVSFTPESLAGIYLGKIKKWNDPLLKAANRGLRLPDLDIIVVHRADGSGTTYAWTDYLSKANPEWRAQVGSGSNPKWPVGQAAKGNEGVAELVKGTAGGIGYVEFIYALKSHLNFGRVRNQRDRFVQANLETIAAAADAASAANTDLRLSLINGEAKDAYPITTLTWIVVPNHFNDRTKAHALADFLRWMLGPGQKQAASLGYLALPQQLITAEQAAIAKVN